MDVICPGVVSTTNRAEVGASQGLRQPLDGDGEAERLNTYLFIYPARDETVYVSLAYCQMNRINRIINRMMS